MAVEGRQPDTPAPPEPGGHRPSVIPGRICFQLARYDSRHDAADQPPCCCYTAPFRCRPSRPLVVVVARCLRIRDGVGTGWVTRLRGLCRLDLACEFESVSVGACTLRGCTAASCRGRFPVQRAEVSLPGEVSFTVQLCCGALAGAPRTSAITAPWIGSRSVLCRMLLGADDADVRRRGGQSGLDVRSVGG